MWEELKYNMEHIDTTDSRFNPQTKESQIVFLGMRVLSTANRIWTSVQPKGDGWMWLPRKFIDYSSCHTHYTKWYMFKGLLIRTLTICNSQEDFMKGVIHYAQRLIARGFPVTAIKRAWNKFIYEKIQQPAVRHKLTEDLLSWLRKQDFSGAFPDEENKKEEQKNKCLRHYEGTLMCGLVALNHI